MHQTEVEVRYAETDAMGVVHHSVYAVWMELSRIHFLRQHGLPYEDLEGRGLAIPVVEISVRYLLPAHFGNTVVLAVRLEREGSARFRFVYRVLRGSSVLAEGFTRHVFTRGGKACRPPDDFVLVTERLEREFPGTGPGGCHS